MLAPLLALASVGWLALLVITPFAPASLATAMYTAGAIVCHQIPDRSFHLGGVQIPVCARCLGIYAGAAIAASACVIAPLAGRQGWRMLSPRTARRVFVIAAIPTLLTVALEHSVAVAAALFDTAYLQHLAEVWADAWRGGNILRALAGAALGVGGAIVVMGAVATLHYSECQRRRPIGPSRMPPHS